MFETSTCDNFEHHQVFWDEIDGQLYHDGCSCTHEQADNLGYHGKCCNSQNHCPYKTEENGCFSGDVQ